MDKDKIKRLRKATKRSEVMPRIEQADVLFSHLQIVPDIRSR